jgi:hypothetical protein
VTLAGQKFARLTVISRSPVSTKNGGARWECICECGGKTVTTTYQLRSGHTRSCGCFRRERNLLAVVVHGRTHTPEYDAWQSMKKRCLNSSDKDFHYYGGRGISICPEWIDDFEAFFAELGERPSAKHSLDRINPYGNYEPGNCRWATILEQRLNTRRRIERLQRECNP